MPTVDISLNQVPCVALVDSGSSVSLISEMLAGKLNKGLLRLSKDPIPFLLNSNGERIRVSGKVELELSLGPFTERMQFVVADIKHEVILGLDFLLMTSATISFARGKLMLSTGEVDMKGGFGRRSNSFPVTLEKTVSIAPHSEIIAMGHVQGLDDKSSEFLFEGITTGSGIQGVMAARALVQPRNNVIPVRLCNLSNDVVNLRAGHHLGKAETHSSIEKPQMVSTVSDNSNGLELKRDLRDLLGLESLPMSRAEKEQLLRLVQEFDDIWSNETYETYH